MPAVDNLTHLFFLVLIIAFFVFVNWLKQSDRKKFLSQFKREDIIIHSHGVTFFGLQSENGKILNSGGQMVLLKQGLHYKGRFDKKELVIPEEKLISIAVTDHHKGESTYGKCIAFYFENQEGIVERAAFLLPYPDNWIKAILHHFGKKIEVKEEIIF